MKSLKSRLIKTTFSEIYPYKNGQKVLALGAIELNKNSKLRIRVLRPCKVVKA